MNAAAVADAVRSHVGWMRALASLPGGREWTDEGWHWALDGPYGTLHALFPAALDTTVAARGLEVAREVGAAHVAVWSAADRPAPGLGRVGFETGWAPWWMSAPTAGFDAAASRLSAGARRSLHTRSGDAARQALLDRDDTFRFDAHTPDGRYAGRTWLHLTDDVAGLYDMAVRPRLRRQGHGRALLAAAGVAAAERGVDRITLNATPEGALLYAACGFRRVGTGRTWWWHREPKGERSTT